MKPAVPVNSVQERLRRLLFLVPFVARHPGRPVHEVAQALGLSREALLEELDLLAMVGRPPFQPDDFIDIYVEDDCVYVEFDQRFSAPPRLTVPEGVALAAAAKLLEADGSEALRAALSRLLAVLPPEAAPRLAELSARLQVSSDAPPGVAPLTQAIARHVEVRFDYLTAGREAPEPRHVQPWELFSHRGQWYLSGFCLTRQEERLFRVDRLARVEVTTSAFTPPEGKSARGVPDVAARGGEVRVRFSKRVAAGVVERFGDAARLVGDGEVEVQVPGDSERWLTGWVLSFGGEARVLEPEHARQAVARAARAALERYRP